MAEKMPKIIELRQDRNLIRPDFDGYKLSLEPIPVFRQELQCGPLNLKPNEDQYSFLHAELFSMQNLLVVDPWQRNTAFFINRMGEITRSSYSENTGRPESLQIVYRIGAMEYYPGDYNMSFAFISEKFCVLCDGKETLLLLDTGDRRKSAEWKEVARTRILVIEIENQPARNFRLYDCRLDTIDERKEISLALGRVQRVDSGNGSNFHMHIHWAKWVLENVWNFSILDTLESKGAIYYCAFEPRAKSLILSSNREWQFRSQRKEIQENMVVEEQTQSHADKNNINVNRFDWCQTDDDIIIKFNVRDNHKNDYDVNCNAEKITVKCIDDVLLENALYEKVDLDLTTWTVENNSLQITLAKTEFGKQWPTLFADGSGPIECLDINNQNELPVEQRPIPNIEAPIEDCDFPMGSDEDEIKIERFNLSTTSLTHCIHLGASPPLFSTNLRPGFPAAIATRQDVDASLWLQQYSTSKPDVWSLRHEGNLHAFGYVQASKQQKKFIDCSPDLNYAIICEATRHIFLYKSNYDTANGLRKRNGPQVSIGKQHLITLDNDGEVLGVATAPNVVTLLTEKNVLFFQINALNN